MAWGSLFHQNIPPICPIKMSHQNVLSEKSQKVSFFSSSFNFSTVVLLKSSTFLHYSDYIGAVLDIYGMFWDVLGCFWDVLGCFGNFWDILGHIGMVWDVLGCFVMFFDVF